MNSMNQSLLFFCFVFTLSAQSMQQPLSNPAPQQVHPKRNVFDQLPAELLHIITGHVAANTQPQQTVSNLLNLASTNQRFHQIVRNSQLVQPAST